MALEVSNMENHYRKVIFNSKNTVLYIFKAKTKSSVLSCLIIQLLNVPYS